MKKIIFETFLLLTTVSVEIQSLSLPAPIVSGDVELICALNERYSREKSIEKTCDGALIERGPGFVTMFF